MSEQCVNPQNGRSKVSYRNRAQAAKAARRSPGAGIKFYCCKHCRKYHLTSGPLDRKKEFIPSASKLRRKLENAGREIAACERRIRKSEELRKLAEQSKTAYQEELAAIEVMVNRLHRV